MSRTTINDVITKDELIVYNDKIKQTYATKESVPTDNNQLANGKNYQTDSDVQGAISQAALSGDWQSGDDVEQAINDAIKDIVGIKFEIVGVLPGEGKPGTIYLKSAGEPGDQDNYEEYVWVTDGGSGRWEKFGSISTPDLSNYLQVTDVTVCPKGDIIAMFE